MMEFNYPRMVFIVILILCSGKSESQISLLSDHDTIKDDLIMIGTDYTSNTSSYGRFSELAKQPSFSGLATYYSKYGFNLGLSSIAIGNSDSTAANFTYEYDLNFGYDLDIGKHLSVTALYSHFFYSKNSNSIKSLYNNEIEVGVNLEVSKMYANIRGYYVMGSYNEWMNSLNAGFNLEIENVFKKHSITMSPELGAMFSNQKYYNQYAYKTYWYLSGPIHQNPDLTVQDIYDYPRNYILLWRYLNKHPQVLENFRNLDKDLVLRDLFQAKNHFNLSSVSFSIPIYYNMENFSLYISYSINFPLNLPKYLDNSSISYISAGLFYSFNL